MPRALSVHLLLSGAAVLAITLATVPNATAQLPHPDPDTSAPQAYAPPPPPPQPTVGPVAPPQPQPQPAAPTEAAAPQAAPSAAPPPQQQAALVGPTQFDGTYSVDVLTSDGKCGESRWTVSVSHGQIASVAPNTHGITAAGLIEDDGTVSMSFHDADGNVAHVGGKVKIGSGTGAWSSPTALCGGTWRAAKAR